jgi:hypothetical protein
VILTDHFVFLHLHKAGGTFVNDFLLACVPNARQVGYHLPRSMIPESHRDLPIVGFVRSPWSYYVSWYTFQKRRAEPNALFRILSDDGRLDFEPTVRNMLDLCEGGPRLAALARALPQTYANRGLNVPGPVVASIEGSGLGFFAFLYRHLFGEDTGRRYIGRMERLRDTLLLTCELAGMPVTDSMRRYLAVSPARNTSEHGAYMEYFGAPLREHVARRDALVIERHGYGFGE